MVVLNVGIGSKYPSIGVKTRSVCRERAAVVARRAVKRGLERVVAPVYRFTVTENNVIMTRINSLHGCDVHFVKGDLSLNFPLSKAQKGLCTISLRRRGEDRSIALPFCRYLAQVSIAKARTAYGRTSLRTQTTAVKRHRIGLIRGKLYGVRMPITRIRPVAYSCYCALRDPFGWSQPTTGLRCRQMPVDRGIFTYLKRSIGQGERLAP